MTSSNPDYLPKGTPKYHRHKTLGITFQPRDFEVTLSNHSKHANQTDLGLNSGLAP